VYQTCLEPERTIELKRKGRKGLRKGRKARSSLRFFAISLASFALKFMLDHSHKFRFHAAL